MITQYAVASGFLPTCTYQLNSESVIAYQTTNLDYYTIKGNKTLKAVFMRMLDKFIGAVSSKRLPNYFIRSVIEITHSQSLNTIEANPCIVV